MFQVHTKYLFLFRKQKTGVTIEPTCSSKVVLPSGKNPREKMMKKRRLERTKKRKKKKNPSHC